METTLLNEYLKLEREMIDLDNDDDPLADALRDRMDPIWYSLSDAEREFLAQRAEKP